MKAYKLLLGSLLFFVLSCDLGDDFAEVPMYVEVSAIDLVTKPGEGFATHDIRDVWVSIDGFSRGIFEVTSDKPARIPVLSDGETVRVEFFAGIRSNGISLSPFLYPFVERIVYDLEFRPGETVPVDIEFEYKQSAVFPILDGFEGVTIFTDDLDEDPSGLEVCTDPEFVQYGNGVGKFVVTEENAFYLQATSQIYSTEDFNASNVYLEIDFKTDIRFSLGYVGYQNNIKQSVVVGGGNATDEWTKLYLDLSADLNGGNVDQFQLLIAGGSLEPGTVLIDNVKLVYLEN